MPEEFPLPKIQVVVNNEESEVLFQDVTGEYGWVNERLQRVESGYLPQEYRKNSITRVLRIYGNQPWLSSAVSGSGRNVTINIEGDPYKPLNISGLFSCGYARGMSFIDIEKLPKEKQVLTVDEILNNPNLLREISESPDPIGRLNELTPNSTPGDRLRIMKAAAPKE